MLEKTIIVIAGVVIGGIAGGITAWILAKARMSVEVGRAEARASALEEQLSAARADMHREQADAHLFRMKATKAETENTGLLEKLETQKAELEQLQKRLTTEFENIASRILDEKTQKFTEQNRVNLDGILTPLNERIGEFRKKVEETYEKEARDRSSLQGEIKQLFELNQRISKDANSLTTALKGGSKTQGNWGEMILETILERSGLVKDREYVVQESRGTEGGGRVQPDVVINLPEKRNMVIDAKVSLKAYELYCSAEDPGERDRLLAEHVASVRNHLKGLSEKNYQSAYGINSPDFVLMFMPVEPAFALATNADRELFGDAFKKSIVIVSPSTLLATLKTVESIWRQDKQNRNAARIAQEAGALYDKFAGLVEDMKKVGNQLNTVQKTYGEAMNKLETGRGCLIGRVESLKVLGAKASKSLPVPQDETDSEIAGGTPAPQES